MNHKRNFLVVITALILVCAVPISASARGNYSYGDADMQEYHFTNSTADITLNATNSPGFHLVSSNYEIIARYHTTNTSWFSFVMWVPLLGYYFVTFQTQQYPTDYTNPYSGNTYFFTLTKRSNSNSSEATTGLFQFVEDNWSTGITGIHTILGKIVSIIKINTADETTLSHLTYSTTRYSELDDSDKTEFLGYVNDKLSSQYPNQNYQAQIIPGIGDAASEELTYPNGDDAPTNEAGNPAPTNEWGETVPTLPNGKPTPTYPNGKPVQHWYDSSGNMHTVPYDEVNGEAYPTVHNPDGTVDIVTTTVINNGEVESDARENFSKLRMWVTSLDLFETLASSVYDDVSDKVDNTRGLIDDVFGCFPVWLPAVIMLGMVVILAIKIIGR